MSNRMNRFDAYNSGHCIWRRATTAIGLGLYLASVAAAQSNLPKGEALLDKSVEAAGGKAAFEKMKNRKTSVTLEMPAMGLKGSIVTWQAPPNKAYACTELPGMGKIEEGVSGDVAWQLSMMTGPQIKEGDERALALRGAHYNSEADWRAIYKSAECTGEEKVDDTDCYKLILTPKEAGKPETHYIDKATGHVICAKMTLVTQMGEAPIESHMSDFRKEGDITVAHKTVIKTATIEMVMTTDKIEANVEIPADRFDLPADIQALLKKSAGGPATSAPADRKPAPKPAEKAGDKPEEKTPEPKKP